MLGQSQDRVPGGDRLGVRADRLLALQPAVRAGAVRRAAVSDHTMWNQLDYRPLEGFVYAVTPFNFTSIAGNLPTAPALMGNTVLWKPAAHVDARRLHHEAARGSGAAAGRDQLRPRRRGAISKVALEHRDLAGVHFTGCTGVFNTMWETIGRNMEPLPLVPAHRRRDGRQGLHRRARVGGPAGARRGHRARRLRVPGPEVLGGEPRLRAALAVARSARPRRGDDGRDQAGRRARLPELHGRGDRPEGVHKHHRLPRRRARTRRSSPAAGVSGEKGYFIQPTLVETTTRATACCARRSSARW